MASLPQRFLRGVGGCDSGDCGREQERIANALRLSAWGAWEAPFSDELDQAVGHDRIAQQVQIGPDVDGAAHVAGIDQREGKLDSSARRIGIVAEGSVVTSAHLRTVILGDKGDVRQDLGGW